MGLDNLNISIFQRIIMHNYLSNQSLVKIKKLQLFQMINNLPHLSDNEKRNIGNTLPNMNIMPQKQNKTTKFSEKDFQNLQSLKWKRMNELQLWSQQVMGKVYLQNQEIRRKTFFDEKRRKRKSPFINQKKDRLKSEEKASTISVNTLHSHNRNKFSHGPSFSNETNKHRGVISEREKMNVVIISRKKIKEKKKFITIPSQSTQLDSLRRNLNFLRGEKWQFEK